MQSIPENHRILVIDDNPAIHDDFRKVLGSSVVVSSDLNAVEEALFGEAEEMPESLVFELSFASQGQEGLRKVEDAVAEGKPYSLAFVDVRMPPGWDGIETTSHLWKVAPDLQIVICTAYSDYSWDEMVCKIGRSDRLVILKKPFDNVEVLQLASALTEKWRLQQEAKLRIDELEKMVQSRTAELRHSIKILQQNMTSQRRSEERLRKSEERFRLIAENAADLILVVDKDGEPEYFSPSVELSLGLKLADLMETSFFGLIHPDDRDPTVATILKSEEKGICQLLEFRLKNLDGYWRSVEARVCSIREKGDNDPHFVIVARDVTDTRRMESETVRLNRELESQSRSPDMPLAEALATEIESPLAALNGRIRFIQDAFFQLSPLLDEQKKLFNAAAGESLTPEIIAAAAAARKSTDTDYFTDQVPQAIVESLENVEKISRMLADLQESEK